MHSKNNFLKNCTNFFYFNIKYVHFIEIFFTISNRWWRSLFLTCVVHKKLYQKICRSFENERVYLKNIFSIIFKKSFKINWTCVELIFSFAFFSCFLFVNFMFISTFLKMSFSKISFAIWIDSNDDFEFLINIAFVWFTFDLWSIFVMFKSNIEWKFCHCFNDVNKINFLFFFVAIEFFDSL